MKHVVPVLIVAVLVAIPSTLVARTHDEIQWDGFGQRIIEFSGYTWRAKEGGRYGPGNNYFSESEENIRVDDNGWLHIRVTRRDGQWYCPELAMEKVLGYGDYIFKTLGRVDDLDLNLILGMFIWEYQESYESNDVFNGANEFDIEYGRWKNPECKPAQFACQPWHKPGNEHKFDIKLDADDAAISTAFLWHPSGLACRAWRGHSDRPNPSDMIHEWFYGGADVPRNEEPRVHINLWCCDEPPADGQEHEVIITEFKFVPCEPPPGSPAAAPAPAAEEPWWKFW